MSPFRRLAIVLPPSPSEADALAYGGLLTAGLPLEAVRLILPPRAEAPPAHADAEPARVLAALPAPLAALQRAGRVTVVQARGALLDAVLHETVAAEVDLLLVAAGPPGADRRSLVRRLAMKAPCSVWMLPRGAAPAIERILVPVDFSARSADALHVATEIAAATGASCAALHVRFDPTVASSEEVVEAVIDREHEAFTVFTARIDLHGVDVELVLEEGPDVAHTILRVAAEQTSSLVVMGTRGRTRAAAMLIGSETEHTLQGSGVPVLAVKHFGANLRLVQALLDPGFRHREGPRFG